MWGYYHTEVKEFQAEMGNVKYLGEMLIIRGSCNQPRPLKLWHFLFPRGSVGTRGKVWEYGIEGKFFS